MLHVDFPKHIRIENTRLALLYWFVAACALVVILSAFSASEAYYDKKVPTGGIHFWADQAGHSKPEDVNKVDGKKAFCATPEKYDFCYDPKCAWSYRDYQCLDICHPDVQSDGLCLGESERWFKTDNKLFFPTSFHETVYRREKTNSRLQEVTNAQWFVKGLEGLSINFQHEFSVLMITNEGQKLKRGNSFETDAAPENRLLTILTDSTGSEIKRWMPGKDIDIPLGQLLRVAEVDLDSINTKVKRNYMENASTPDGALMRITGVNVEVKVTYQNKMAHGEADWEGPVCYIQLNRESFAWSSMPRTQVIDDAGSTRFRYYYGIQVKFHIDGQFKEWSLSNFITLFTSISVFIRNAKLAVFFFAITCLGHLSKIYNRFSHQHLHLTEECEGAAARLICYNQMFSYLQDTEDGMSERCLRKHIETIFKHKSAEMDDTEIRRFGSFVFNGLRTRGDISDVISKADYTLGCTMSDNLDVDLLVGLFDADRRKPRLEKIFVDGELRELYASDRVSEQALGAPHLPQWRSIRNSVAPSPQPVHPRRHSKNMDNESLETAVEQALDKALAPLRDALSKLQKDVQELQSSQANLDLIFPKKGSHASVLQKTSAAHSNAAVDTDQNLQPLVLGAASNVDATMNKEVESAEVKLARDREEISRLRKFLSRQGVPWTLDMTSTDLHALATGCKQSSAGQLHDGFPQTADVAVRNNQVNGVPSHMVQTQAHSTSKDPSPTFSIDAFSGSPMHHRMALPPPARVSELFMSRGQHEEQQRPGWTAPPNVYDNGGNNGAKVELTEMAEHRRHGMEEMRGPASTSPSQGFVNGGIRDQGGGLQGIFID